MIRVYWGFILLLLAHSTFTNKDDPKPEIIAPPKLVIIREGNTLQFKCNVTHPSCTMLTFHYTKCGEAHTINGTNSDCCPKVPYDQACKYTVRVQAISSQYCLDKFQSPMSEPVIFGEDRDLNVLFKVTMIIIPMLLSCCLVGALVLFQRYKNTLFPKVPDPSLFIKDMFDKNINGEAVKDQVVGKLFEANEVVTDSISVEPETTLLQP